MREQEANRLAIMRTSTSLRQRRTDINRLDLIAGLFLILMRDGIRRDESAESAAVEVLDGFPRENAVDDDGVDLAGAVLHDGVGGFDEGAAGVGHVVDDDGDLVLDVADEDHAGDFVGTSAFFVDEGELQVEAVCDGGCSGLVRNLINPTNLPMVVTHLFAPPASGLTMTQLFTSRCSRIHLSILGSA